MYSHFRNSPIAFSGKARFLIFSFDGYACTSGAMIGKRKLGNYFYSVGLDSYYTTDF